MLTRNITSRAQASFRLLALLSLLACSNLSFSVESEPNQLTQGHLTKVAELDVAPLELIQDDSIDVFLDSAEPQDIHYQESLWHRIKDGFEMADMPSDFTTKHENWYASRPDYVSRMLDRSQKYLFYIVEEVDKRNMPMEVALLPMIESAFNPQAYSTSHASGIWQFVPATGKDFGLKQNWMVDNRRDVTAATNAALTYLQKLHGMFGSWDLALAAYNAGEGTVQRAINKNRDQGLPTDYAHLSLPIETRNYVPKLMAIKNIIANPEKFNLIIKEIPNRPYFVRVTAPKQIDAKLAAQLAEISYDEFSALNPSYNRPVITSTGEGHALLLPAWSAETFTQNLANYDKPLSQWQTYKAKKGEQLSHIAKKFGMMISDLRHVNSLSSQNKLRSNQTMFVPASTNSADTDSVGLNQADLTVLERQNSIQEASDENTAQNEPKAARQLSHKVKRGDTLSLLAKKYRVDTKYLMRINGLSSKKVKVGQTLVVNNQGVSNHKNAKFTRASVSKSKSRLVKTSAKKSRVTKTHASKAHVAKDRDKRIKSHKVSRIKVKASRNHVQFR